MTETAREIMSGYFGDAWEDYPSKVAIHDAIEAAIAAAERRMKERAAEVARAHRIVIGGTSEVIADAILALLPEGDGWMPIGGAPRDGTPVLAAVDSTGAVFDCWWDTEAAGWVDGETNAYDDPMFCHPTHYRPLPNPPTAKE